MRKHLFLYNVDYKNTYLYWVSLLTKRLIFHIKYIIMENRKIRQRRYCKFVIKSHHSINPSKIDKVKQLCYRNK